MKNAVQNCRAGKCETEKCGTKMQDVKMQERKIQHKKYWAGKCETSPYGKRTDAFYVTLHKMDNRLLAEQKQLRHTYFSKNTV